MKTRTIASAVVLILLGVAAFTLPGAQYLDVLILKDGTSYKGVIVEQVPGETLRLETTGGTRMTFSLDEIDSIEKEERSERGLKITYIDVVFLKNGIIFAGTIVEQVPDVSLTLEAANGKEITIGMEEIWKIIREKRLRNEDAPPEEERERMERLKIALELDLSREGRAEAAPAGKESSDSLEEEIGRLEEEMDELDREREEGADDPERAAREEELVRLREELETAQSAPETEQAAVPGGGGFDEIAEILQALTEELLEITKGMWSEDLVAGSQEYKQKIAGLQDRLVESTRKLLEIVAAMPAAGSARESEELADAVVELKAELQELVSEVRSIARQRRQEDILATKTALLPVLTGPDWNTPGLRPAVEQMAASLPYADRRDVYRKSKTRGGVSGALLNVIPVGMGSWMQGDWLGAVIPYGAAAAALGVFGLEMAGVFANEQAALSTRGFLMLGGYLFSLVRPVWYTSSQNGKKKALLGL